jgi:hypothetical protein
LNDFKDPMGRVTLLARKLGIFFQEQPDTLFVGTKNRLMLMAHRRFNRRGIVGEGFSNSDATAPFFP